MCISSGRAGLASLSEAEREALVVSNHLIVRRALLNGPDYCATCWYRQIHCVCKYIPKIDCPFRFLIYMHCKGTPSGPSPCRARPSSRS